MADFLEEAEHAPASMLEVAERIVAEAGVRAARAERVEALCPGSGVLALLAGEFAPQVAEIFAPDPAAYLTATDRRRHIWHCCLAAAERSSWPEQRAEAAALRRRFSEAKGRQLLAEAHGACPPGLERALGKLGATARPRAVYAALVEVLGRADAGAKLLRHARALPDTLILAVAGLPSRFCVAALIAGLSELYEIANILPFFAWTIERLEALGGVDLTDAVRRTKQPGALLRTVLATLPFPPPPWPGDALLVPLTSPDALRAAGARLRNCLRLAGPLAGAAREVVRGELYHYEWRGPEPALLSFRRVEPLGWMLELAVGADNAPLSHRTKAEIDGLLAGVDNVCPRMHDGGRNGFWRSLAY